MRSIVLASLVIVGLSVSGARGDGSKSLLPKDFVGDGEARYEIVPEQAHPV